MRLARLGRGGPASRKARPGGASLLRAPYAFATVASFAVVPPQAGPAHALYGDFNGNGTVSATDALTVLRAAVGLVACDAETCDHDGSGKVRATDALTTLKAAVGQDVTLACPCLSDEIFSSPTCGRLSRRERDSPLLPTGGKRRSPPFDSARLRTRSWVHEE